MTANLILLIVGVIILVVAGDFLVRGAAAFARKWGVPALIVGLTIVAFGTSAPELVVSVQAVIDGASALAFSNVVGSNIANILLALGLPALILAIPTDTPGVTRNTVFAVFATLVLIALVFIHNPLERWQGAILFSGIVGYLFWMFSLARAGSRDPALREMAEIDEMDGLPRSQLISLIFVVGGIIGLAIGGNLIVDNATEMAQRMGVAQSVIGLTLVAIGTSLPEIATVIVAAYRGHNEVAIGNVVGSNIFNIFAVMGAAALTGPIDIPASLMSIDVWVMLGTILLLLGIIIAGKPIGRRLGFAMVLGYGGYCLIIGQRLNDAAMYAA
ncbi:calcium/sodium antiporter [Robiginitomaculum antarcticum]|uniref:calcium/sodium antiporter n=1 Tax=Robiginitomaculum antarcticum TaxID=437507 RepID=UPI00036891D5|nr:calcium/sodium antiporter [Robiginitomaculum antarcticum]